MIDWIGDFNEFNISEVLQYDPEFSGISGTVICKMLVWKLIINRKVINITHNYIRYTLVGRFFFL